jgi:hypothetical protein
MPSSHGHRSRSHSHSSSHREHRSRHSHSRHRSSSRVPSPVRSPGFRPSPSPAPVVQGHHYRPRANSHSSDAQHHQQHHQSRSSQGHDYSRSPSHDYDHSRHGSHSVTPAPPMHISQNSKPNAPYMLVPTTAYTASEFQQSHMTHHNYEPTPDLAPTAFPIPVPSPTPASTAPHGMTSHQFPPTTSTSHAPSAPAPSLLAQEIDAPKATSDGRHSHPLFRHSRCTGKRKAVCVGINYTGQKNELQGCVNDARNIYQFLMGLHRIRIIP